MASTSLAGLICECEFWSHWQWADHVVHWTSPAPPARCRQAWNGPAGLGVSTVTTLGKGYVQVWGTPALHRPLTYIPRKERVLYGSTRIRTDAPSQTGSWLCRHMSFFITYHTVFLGFQSSKHTSCTSLSKQKGSLTCNTQLNYKDLRRGMMLSCNHSRDSAAPPVITHRAWASHYGHTACQGAEEDHNIAREL